MDAVMEIKDAEGEVAAAEESPQTTNPETPADEQEQTPTVEDYKKLLAQNEDLKARQGDFTRANKEKKELERQVKELAASLEVYQKQVEEYDDKILDAEDDESKRKVAKELAKSLRQRKREMDEAAAKLKAKEAELAEKEDKYTALEIKEMVSEIARDKNVDQKKLQEMVTDFEVKDREGIERLVKWVSSANEPPSEKPLQSNSRSTLKGAGTAAMPKDDAAFSRWLDTLTDEEFKQWEPAIRKRQFGKLYGS